MRRDRSVVSHRPTDVIIDDELSGLALGYTAPMSREFWVAECGDSSYLAGEVALWRDGAICIEVKHVT